MKKEATKAVIISVVYAIENLIEMMCAKLEVDRFISSRIFFDARLE